MSVICVFYVTIIISMLSAFTFLESSVTVYKVFAKYFYNVTVNRKKTRKIKIKTSKAKLSLIENSALFKAG